MASVVASAEALYLSGRGAEAEAMLRRHVQRNARDYQAAFCLGNILLQTGRYEQAEFVLRGALRQNGGASAYWQALARALAALKRAGEAGECARRGVALAPESADAHAALGEVMEATGAFAEAERAFDRALEIDPHHRLAHVHLADAALVMGNPEVAAARAERTVAATAGDANHFLQCATSAVFSLYAGDCAAGEVRRRHARVGEVLAKMPPPDPGALSNTREPERALRVAFLSPDFIQHSCSYFVETLLDHLNRAWVVPVALFASHTSDHVTKRLRGKFASWHDLTAPTDTAVQAIMRRERIDVAVDLAGYTTHSIVWPLRARLAPVQVSWLGYPHATGIPAMDARLVDSLTDPAGADALVGGAVAMERLVRVDPCFVCYRPPMGPDDPGCPPVSPMPGLRADAPFTLGSFNLLGKLSVRAKDLWARVLREVPRARLMLKDAALEHEEVRAWIRAEFAKRGVGAERLELLAKTKSRDEHLALYARVDLALDPFPYNGTTTTCEAMFMGVPVATLVGAPGLHPGRVGLSLLTAVGLEEQCAASEDALVALVARWERDRAGLAALRAGLRARLLASPVCDGPGFARRWEGAVRGLWKDWCTRRS